MRYGPLIISLPGYHLDDQNTIDLLQHPLVGGVILFSENYENKAQLTAFIAQMKAVAQAKEKNFLTMVDYEGGYVQRFRTGFSAIPAAKVLGNIYDINPEVALTYARQLGCHLGQELKAVGIDIVLSPIVDLDNGNTVISGMDRAYHQDPQIVTHIAFAYIQGLEASGIASTLKHFPGHGADIGDSHLIQPIDNRPWEVLNHSDLSPFRALIQKGIRSAIMTAHIKYPAIDPDNTAGMSKIWLHDILREELHFNGVIISDCLSMQGAGEDSHVDKILMTLAYADLALLSHQSIDEYLSIFKALEERSFIWSQNSQDRVSQYISSQS